MALRLYHDSAGTEQITEANPDRIREAVTTGSPLMDQKCIYVRATEAGYYESIEITAVEDPPPGAVETTVAYAVDNNGVPGSFVQVLSLPSGDYAVPVPVWRRVTVIYVDEPIDRTDIKHELSWHRFASSP